MTTHDYLVQRLHEARVADFEAAARQRLLVKEARLATRMLARLTVPSVLPFRRRPTNRPDSGAEHVSEAA